MGLGQVIARRLALMVLVLLGVTLLTFLIAHAIPGDPARLMAGQRASSRARRAPPTRNTNSSTNAAARAMRAGASTERP